MRIVLLAIMFGFLCASRVRGDDNNGASLGNTQEQATGPGPSALDQEIAAILPGLDEERWLHIPWQANLMQARLEAQRAGKPLLIWVMDGNVLGCT